MGLLNKSFRDIKKDFFTGQGWSNSLFKTTITQNDFQNLQKFNSAIKIANNEFKITNDRFVKSQQVTKAWNENMSGCSIAAKRMGNDLVTGKKTIKDISAEMDNASVSTKALGIAMNVLANVGLMLAITAVTKVISELSQAQEKAVQMAKEATESYKDEIPSISDYKTRLSELHKELNSGNLSYEETKTKRSELMSIQDELIKNFGTEKTAIEAVTKAIDGQVNSLDALNEKSYRKWFAKADEQTFWNKLRPGGKSGLDQAVDYMESDQTISFFDMSNANSRVMGQYVDLNATITDEVRAIQEEIDKTIQSKYNLEKEFATFKLTGTPDEIKPQLESIRQDYLDLSKEAFLENGISSKYWEAYRSEAIDSINEVINKLDDGLTKHQDTYKTYIEGMIKYDSEYSDEYATILQKRAELESAQNSGDKEKIQKARQSFMEAISQGIEASGTNENIKKYFETLYPELQAEFASWSFEFSLNANTNGIKDIATQIGEKYTATNLLDMVNTEGVQEGEDSFNKLIDKAIEYGICTDNSAEEVQKLIDLLVELGIVQGEVSSETADETDIPSIDKLSEALDKIQSAYQSVQSAIEEFNEEGYLSVDTFQSLMELEPQYLNMLLDENGNLNLNTTAIQENTAAYIENMGVKAAQNLIDGVSALSGASAQMEYLTGVTNENTNATWDNIYAQLAKAEAVSDIAVMDALRTRINAIQQMTESAKAGIGKGGLGKSTSDKKDKKDKKDNTADKVKDINDQLNDLAKSEALDALKYKFDQIEQSVEKLDTTISQLETTLDLTAEDDYISKIGTVGKQMEYASQKTELLRNEFSQLQSEKYISADMANEIASRMKSVADSIAENRKNIIEYGKNITEYYMSALTSVGKLSKETIDESTDLFERNVKTLSEGGLTGLQFNLSPTVPESAYEIQRAENESLEDEMRRYYDAVAEMQKIALDMQYQETVADNARKRQDLLDSLNEAYASQQSYSSSTIGLQKATNNTIKAEQQATNAQTSAVQEADHAKKESTQEDFIHNVKNRFTELNDWMKNNPIKAPELDKTSWDNLSVDIESQVKKIGQTFSDFSLPGGFGDGDNITGMSETRNNMPYYNQGNYSSYSYGKNGTIASSGCGPTAMAMILSSFGKNVDPVKAAKYSVDNGFRIEGNGTSWGFIPSIANAYGVRSASLGTQKSSILSALKAGHPVLMSVQGGAFNPSGHGHFFVLSGISSDGKIYVNDPGSRERTNQVWDINTITSNARNSWAFSAYAKGTRNFPIFGRKVNGIAGENYKPEILMHKKTGEITKINEPTFIDTNEYDVVGEDTTARVLKQYKTGTPTTDKEILDYIKRASDETGVPANIIMAVMDMETGYIWNNGLSDSKNTTSYGYMALNSGGALSGMDSERRQKATTDKYTNVLEGAKVLAAHYKTYGNWQTAIARYNGSGKKADDYGAEVWATANSDAFKKAVESLGSISETVKEIRKDFKTQIQEIINGVKSSATTEDSNKWEDNLLEYIKEKTADSKKSTETYVENFEKLAQYQKDSEKIFKDIDKQLLSAVGTPDFAKVRTQGNQQIQDYIAAVMGMQVDMETAQIKEQFAYAKDIQRITLEYYNERKENEATADELLAIADAYSEITSQVNELSDAYVDAIKAETDFLSNNAQNKMKKYADELSWINDEWDELERKLEKTDDEKDLVLQDNLFKAELENLNKQTEVYVRQQREAHQNVLDLYNNKEYSPIFDRFDIESWFDANGEITSQFNDDVARMGAYDETSHLVPLMNQLVELIKTYKQSWYEAADAIVDVEDNIQDVKDAQKEKENNRMLARVDKYVEYQERLMEALDFEKSMNDAVSTAKSSYYDFIDSLREEQNSIDTQLKKNMQLDDWLSEDTRKQLFNLDDYNEETKEINRLQEQAQRLYENYQNDISNLSEQDAYLQESITAEYNKRTEALQDQLSIAKQQLQVKKDEAAFENALKERDTQIILGNRVQNVADPENLSNLAEAKAQSELELDNLKAKSVEAEDIRDMERISDDLAKEKAARGNMVAMINEASDEYKIALANFIEPIELITAKLNSLAKYNPVDMINGDNSDEIYQSFDPEKIGTGYNFDYDYSDGVWVNDTAHIAGLENRSMYEAAKARLRNQHDYKALTDGRYSDKVFDLYNSDLSYDKNANFLHKFFKPSEAETFFKEFDVGNAKLKRMVDKTGEDVESIYKRIDLIEKYPQLKQQTRNTDNPIFKLMDIYRTLGGFMNDGLTKTYNTGKTTEYHINTINIKESAKDMDSLLTQIATQAAAGIEPAYSTIKNQR